MRLTLAELRFEFKSEYMDRYQKYQRLINAGQMSPSNARRMLARFRNICRAFMVLSEAEYARLQERLEKGEGWEGLELDL